VLCAITATSGVIESQSSSLISDFERVYKLGCWRMELAREATAARATGEVEAINALISAHRRPGEALYAV
jgi:hypothetical protein